MLQAYRSTNHQATKMTPYYLLMNRGVRTRLEHFPTETNIAEMSKSEHQTTPRNTLKIGNALIVKHDNKRKSQRPYEPYITLSKQLTMNFCRKYRKRDRQMSLSRNSADKNVTMVNFLPLYKTFLENSKSLLILLITVCFFSLHLQEK